MASQWVLDRCGFEAKFSFAWYPAAYDTFFMSIMPAGNILQHIPREQRDVAILEEPEHLSWFNRSFRWSLEFSHVIGAQAINLAMPLQTSSAGLITQCFHLQGLCTPITLTTSDEMLVIYLPSPSHAW